MASRIGRDVRNLLEGRYGPVRAISKRLAAATGVCARWSAKVRLRGLGSQCGPTRRRRACPGGEAVTVGCSRRHDRVERGQIR